MLALGPVEATAVDGHGTSSDDDEVTDIKLESDDDDVIPGATSRSGERWRDSEIQEEELVEVDIDR